MKSGNSPGTHGPAQAPGPLTSFHTSGGDTEAGSTPSNSPVTPKLQASRVVFCEVVTLTSRQSSSSDQLLAWATYCLVAVMYASGTNRPPRHTWMFCGERQPR